MNVSMIVSLAPGDVGAGSQAGAAADGGEGFGLAVKDAAEQHGGKAKAANNDGRRRAEGKDEGDKAADNDGTAAAPEAEAAPADGANPTGDVLGRILGLSFLAGAGQFPAPSAADNAAANEAGNGAAPGELEERIVISTVADLAGAPAEDQSKRVALRVTSMETHFEPHQNAPKLVDAKAASGAATASVAAQLPAASETAETGAEPVKTPFAEILQRLDAGRSDKGRPAGGSGSNDDGRQRGDEGEAKTPAAERNAAASRRTENAGQNNGVRPWTPAADRSDAARASTGAGNGQGVGQMINAQLAERIIGAFADQPSSAAEPAAASQTSATQVLRLTAGGGALKTLSIQLEPQDLGRVDVSMRLIDGRLTVELAASEPSTAATLAGDRHGLRKILEHAGFALDDAAITIVARDPGFASAPSSSASGGDAGTGRQPAPQDQAFGNGNGTGREPDGRSAERQQRFARETAGDEKTSTAGSRGGSVYL